MHHLSFVTLFLYSVCGLVAGKVFNSINQRVALFTHLHVCESTLVSAVVQIAALCLVPYALCEWGCCSFVSDWQVSIEGLLWISMFLSMQSNITSTLQQV